MEKLYLRIIVILNELLIIITGLKCSIIYSFCAINPGDWQF